MSTGKHPRGDCASISWFGDFVVEKTGREIQKLHLLVFSNIININEVRRNSKLYSKSLET